MKEKDPRCRLAAAVSFAPTANAELDPHIPQPPIW